MPGINFKEVFAYVCNFNDRYLIIGFRPDVRGNPPTFEKVIYTAKDQEQVFTLINRLSQFKVFELGKESRSMNEWVEAKKNNDAQIKEKEEKALLEKLKVKYEGK